MAIGNAVQRDRDIYIYDENNNLITHVPAGTGGDDGLKSCTSSEVKVQVAGTIYTYNDEGRMIDVEPLD